MPYSNAHIAIRNSWPLIGGNPLLYLNCLRDAKNARSSYPPDRIRRDRGKFEFAGIVTQAGGRAPKTFALVEDGIVKAGAFDAGTTISEALEQLPHGHYFCKPNRGRNGIGAFRLRLTVDGAIVDDAAQSPAAVAARLSTADYVIQEWLAPRQDSDVARFHDGVINTVRLITFDTDAGPRAVAASLRMAIGRENVDNWSQGGVVAPIDLGTGFLCGFGVVKKELRVVDSHPGSGLAFRGQKVPHFDEAVAMACALQGRLNVKSLGWDIALLDDGPCILESNRPWDIFLSAQLNPGFLADFMGFHLPGEVDAVARLDLRGSLVNRNALRYGLCAALGQAQVSGRVDDCSDERVILTVAGTRAALRSAVGAIRTSASRLGIAGMNIEESTSALRPGLDIDATFSED